MDSNSLDQSFVFFQLVFFRWQSKSMSKTGLLFQQDNATPHDARITQIFLHKRHNVLPWLSRSPDINPACGINLDCVQDSVHRNICVRLNGRYPRMGVDISAGNSASGEIQEKVYGQPLSMQWVLTLDIDLLSLCEYRDKS